MSAICFDQVSKLFPAAGRPSVNGVSFEVLAGEFVVLLGPSGCGKTTLLKMVNRLYEPSAGRILLNGQDIQQRRVTDLRRQIGYVIQQTGLFPHMTVAQNIGVVPQLLGWPAERIALRVDELLELVDLAPAEYRRRYPSQLSGGQQQRVGLARALASDPELMLMDEPFGAIDAITRSTLQDEMLRLKRQLKKTILFVTHDVEEALRLADRIVVMEGGQVVQYDTPFNILTHPANEFVASLIGAQDMVRRLGLLSVEAAMVRASQSTAGQPLADGPTISRDADLRTALSLLLRTGAPALAVIHQGQVIGMLALEDIRAMAQESPAV